MSAGEFFDITCDSENICLYGIEDEELYRENVESFRRVAAKRAEQTDNLDKFDDQLSALAEKVYSGDLRQLNDNCRLHRDGTLSFSDHWKVIEGLAKKCNVDISRYTELPKLLESIKLETSIDFAKANTERQELIDMLSGGMDKSELEGLVLRSLAFKQNKMSQGDYHRYLSGLAAAKNIPAEGYENLTGFTRYVTIYESVELAGVYREMEGVEDAIREKLYRNGDERELYGMARMARLLKQLYAIELTTREFEYFMKNRVWFSAERCSGFIREKCGKYGVPVSGGYDISEIMEGIPGAMKFYTDAQSRDNAMLNNTLKRMREEGKHVAALITGGYHTEGLTDIMRQKGLSYLVVVPKFEGGKERPYVAILTNKKRPYEKILESGRYQLAVSAYFYAYEGDLSRLKPAIFHALGEAVLEGKDIDTIKDSWKGAYRVVYASTSEKRRKAMKFAPVTPKDFEDFLQRVTVRKVSKAAVIAEVTSEGISFITLAKKGETFDFNPASKAQRDVFLARTKTVASEEEKRAVEFTIALQELEENTELAGETEADLENITFGLNEAVKGKDHEEIISRLDLSGTLAASVAEVLDGRELDAGNVREILLRDLGDEGLSLPSDWGRSGLKESVRSFIAAVKERQKLDIVDTLLATRSHVFNNKMTVPFGHLLLIVKADPTDMETVKDDIECAESAIIETMNSLQALDRVVREGRIKKGEESTLRRVIDLEKSLKEGTILNRENREILEGIWDKEYALMTQMLGLLTPMVRAISVDAGITSDMAKCLHSLSSCYQEYADSLNSLCSNKNDTAEQKISKFNDAADRLYARLQISGEAPEKITKEFIASKFKGQQRYYSRTWADSVDENGRLVKGFARELLEAGQAGIFYSIVKSEDREAFVNTINEYSPYIGEVRQYVLESAEKGRKEQDQALMDLERIDKKGLSLAMQIKAVKNMEQFRHAGEFAKKAVRILGLEEERGEVIAVAGKVSTAEESVQPDDVPPVSPTERLKEEPKGIMPGIAAFSFLTFLKAGIISCPAALAGIAGIFIPYLIYKYSMLHAVKTAAAEKKDIKLKDLQRHCRDILGRSYNVQVISDDKWDGDKGRYAYTDLDANTGEQVIYIKESIARAQDRALVPVLMHERGEADMSILPSTFTRIVTYLPLTREIRANILEFVNILSYAASELMPRIWGPAPVPGDVKKRISKLKNTVQKEIPEAWIQGEAGEEWFAELYKTAAKDDGKYYAYLKRIMTLRRAGMPFSFLGSLNGATYYKGRLLAMDGKELEQKLDLLAKGRITVKPEFLNYSIARLTERVNLINNLKTGPNEAMLRAADEDMEKMARVNETEATAAGIPLIELLRKKVKFLKTYSLTVNPELLGLKLQDISGKMSRHESYGIRANDITIKYSADKLKDYAVKTHVTAMSGSAVTDEDLEELADMILDSVKLAVPEEDLSLLADLLDGTGFVRFEHKDGTEFSLRDEINGFRGELTTAQTADEKEKICSRFALLMGEIISDEEVSEKIDTLPVEEHEKFYKLSRELTEEYERVVGIVSGIKEFNQLEDMDERTVKLTDLADLLQEVTLNTDRFPYFAENERFNELSSRLLASGTEAEGLAADMLYKVYLGLEYSEGTARTSELMNGYIKEYTIDRAETRDKTFDLYRKAGRTYVRDRRGMVTALRSVRKYLSDPVPEAVETLRRIARTEKDRENRLYREESIKFGRWHDKYVFQLMGIP
ncbi:MAG: hypothetical protein ABIA77_01055, partial [Candidatus Omnitrophota bacterium]